MRLGQNPAKFVDRVAQPQKITVAIVTYIPFIGSYYAQSLEVLKACLESLWQHTDLPYDLFIFDNASCKEVRNYLTMSQNEGRIQYLTLSEKNIGKGGAWNIIFGGATGEIIAYADSDIYFYSGWLSALVKVLEMFPNIGMVTGLPLWSPAEFSTSTVAWAEKNPEIQIENGQFLPWEDYWRHSRSLGKDENEARRHFESRLDTCLFYKGEKFYVGAGHFQFIAYRKVLQQALPIPSERPMGQVRSLDIVINDKNYLRLSTSQWWVQHVGNTLNGLAEIHRGLASPPSKKIARLPNIKIRNSPLARKLLIWVHNKTFDILYRNKSN